MISGVTAILTAMTDAERPWVSLALDSVLAQTTPVDSLIVVVHTDNDWMKPMLDALRAPGSGRQLPPTQLHRMQLAPVGAVRNAGVALAVTRWVAFIDGDDLWRPQRLEQQLLAARQQPAATFVGCDLVFINTDDQPFAYANGDRPAPSGWLVDRALMSQYPFDPEARHGEDHFWLQSTLAVCQRVRVNRPLVAYRVRGLSISTLQYGHTTQRKRRELLARMSFYLPLRLATLSITYLRYLLARRPTYNV